MKQLIIDFNQTYKISNEIVGNYEFELYEKSVKDIIGKAYKDVKKYILKLIDIRDKEVITYYFNKESKRKEQVEYFKKLAKKNKL